MLIVDGANVVGSRPDGWWRDRAGAARRLHGRIVAAIDGGALDTAVILVLEGAARRGVDATERPTTARTVGVMHAPGSGDDAIVELVSALADTATPMTVVTADRELRGRVEKFGADVVGPGWLLDRLDGADMRP
jgi:hypothetical protein